MQWREDEVGLGGIFGGKRGVEVTDYNICSKASRVELPEL